MPPKPKFTREEIIDAALELVSEKGIEALTARNIGDRLGISARPVFTAFTNMEEVQREVRNAARTRFEDYVKKAADYTPAIKQMGMQVLLFAREEPNLFELLFMKNDGEPHSLDEGFLSNNGNKITSMGMELLQKDYGLDYEEARRMFHHLWIFTFGLGALYTTGMCSFSDEELNDLLGRDFLAMLAQIKSGGLRKPTVHPSLREENADGAAKPGDEPQAEA